MLWKCGLMEASVREGHSWTPPFSHVSILLSGATFWILKTVLTWSNKKTQHSKRLKSEHGPAAAPLSDGPHDCNYFWHFSKTMSEVWLKVSHRWRVSGRHSQSRSFLLKKQIVLSITQKVCVTTSFYLVFFTRLENKSSQTFASAPAGRSPPFNLSLLQFCIIDALRW